MYNEPRYIDPDTIKWTKSSILELIKQIDNESFLSSFQGQQTIALLKSGLFVLCQLEGHDFSLTTEETIGFLSLENMMIIAATITEGVEQRDKDFVRLMLMGIPGFKRKTDLERQLRTTRDSFCGIHLLLLSQHADQCVM